MKLFSKSVATGILFLSVATFMSNPADAAWFGKKDDVQTCKAKLEDNRQLAQEATAACSEEISNFYVVVDKLKSDLQSLKDSQKVSEKLFSELQSAHERWGQDGFRVDVQTYADYAVAKNKFMDKNREIDDQKAVVISEMKDVAKVFSSEKAKKEYIKSIDNTLEAFFKYSSAVAIEAAPVAKEQK